MLEPNVSISHIDMDAVVNSIEEDLIRRIADETLKALSTLPKLENKYALISSSSPSRHLFSFRDHFVRKIHIIPDNYIKLNYNNSFFGDQTYYFEVHKYYFQSRYDFRLADRLSYFPELERHILRMLAQLEASVDQEDEQQVISFHYLQNPYINRSLSTKESQYLLIHTLKHLLEQFISDGKFYFCLDDTCREEIIVFEDVNNNTALDTTIQPFFIQEALDQLRELLKALKHEIAILKRLIAEAIRIQFLANQILNRVSCSPTPQKKEPPIGGVKVGGEQHDVVRHVVKILYFKQKLAA